jgi:3-hydroxybutyryl-CoA dehydrogenase
MSNAINPADVEVGVVGLGLMGCSITACLLMAGHQVVAIAPVAIDLQFAEKRIHEHLLMSHQERMVKEPPEHYFENLLITEDYEMLKECKLVIECTLENLDIKKTVYQKIEAVIDTDALSYQQYLCNTNQHIAATNNTSTQVLRASLGRAFAYYAFLEVICGDNSGYFKGRIPLPASHAWGKEPTLVRKDIRGFITNRLMYAMYREAFNLVENGYATVEDVDRACRNNAGYWMTLVGVFRWMDLTGVPAYHTVMKDLFPTLSNQTTIPALIDDIVKAGGRGVANGKGFYDYTPEEAKLWEETFRTFSYEIRELCTKISGRCC